MRAPVIVALGLSGLSRRTLLRADLLGCGLWAAIYTLLGTIGGRLTSHPLAAVAIAVGLAVTVGVVTGWVINHRQNARLAHTGA